MTPFAQLFDRRIRGFRVIEVLALLALGAMILWVYLTKADAGREGAEISDVRREIAEERRELKQLRAESAHLEQYQRIESLSHAYLRLEPVKPARETAPENLARIAAQSGSAPR
jgi:hypothetical protein